HQDGIERLPAGAALLKLVRCEHHRLDLGAKALPRHETINGSERIAHRRQGFQALIGIEKSQLPHHRLCESKSHASDSHRSGVAAIFRGALKSTRRLALHFAQYPCQYLEHRNSSSASAKS